MNKEKYVLNRDSNYWIDRDIEWDWIRKDNPLFKKEVNFYHNNEMVAVGMVVGFGGLNNGLTCVCVADFKFLSDVIGELDENGFYMVSIIEKQKLN